MKLIKYIILLLLCLGLNIVEIHAQEIRQEKMDVKMNMSHQQDGKIDVTLTYILPPKLIDADGSYTFIPTIKGVKGETYDLPKVLVNGAKRGQKYYDSLKKEGNNKEDLPEILSTSKEGKKYQKLLTTRKDDDLTDDNFHTAISYNNKDTYTMTYKTTIEYEKWMSGANLEVVAEPCADCDGLSKETVYFPLGIIPTSVANGGDGRLLTAKVIKHFDHQEMQLSFALNNSVLVPDYASNRAELEQVESAIRKIQSNSLLKLVNVSIIAYASPEGPYDNNSRLSLERSLAFADYLKANFSLDAGLLKVSFVPEDWEGFVALIQADKVLNPTEKIKIINIIEETSDINTRKNRLKAYGKGKPYKYMLENIYPQLRRISCDIEYEESEMVRGMH